ncbi:Hypothetical protein D9617_1g085610 [Elsinoe fawcettii]|nr:Hypothetical protein D9617_1g085610 [Elsinoe fawcettii]
MGFLSKVWWLCHKLCWYGTLFTTALIVTILTATWFLAFSPYVAGVEYEAYVHNQTRQYLAQNSATSGVGSPDTGAQEDTRFYDKHVTTPLIRNATQVWSESMEPIGLHDGEVGGGVRGYGKGSAHENWIYLGGTNPGIKGWLSTYSLVAHANESCVDEPAVCDAYNAGYQRLVDQYHTRPAGHRPKGDLKFIDCDVSPAICDWWQLNPVMLVHVKTQQPCHFITDFETGRPRLLYLCSVKWTYVGLPFDKMPYNRNIRIGGKLVPAFPSEYEQLRSVVWYDGALQTLEGQEAITSDYYDASEAYGAPEPPIELGTEGKYDAYQAWGQDLAMWYLKLRGKITGSEVDFNSEKYVLDRPFG